MIKLKASSVETPYLSGKWMELSFSGTMTLLPHSRQSTQAIERVPHRLQRKYLFGGHLRKKAPTCLPCTRWRTALVGTCHRGWCRWTWSMRSCCCHHWGTYRMGRRIPWERRSIGWQEMLALCTCLWWLCSFGTQSSQGNLISIGSNKSKNIYATCRYQKYRTRYSSENGSMEHDLMLLGIKLSTMHMYCSLH